MNGPALRLFGIGDKKDILGRKLIQFISPKYKEIVKDRIKKVFSGEWKETPRTEIEVMRVDGKEVPVEVKGMRIFYENREAVISIMRDVSERKEADKKLRSLAQFPEENPNPVIRAMGNGQVQYANKPAREMLASLDWRENHPLPEPLLSSVKTALEKGERPRLEVECREGRIYFIELAPSLTDGHINLYGRDITDRKIAEKSLAEAQAELRGRIEEQLVESYRHMGIVNRKISLLLEVGKGAEKRKNKQEVSDYIVNSAVSLSGARIGMLYVSLATNHLSLVSSNGIDEEKKSRISIVSRERLNFINKLFAEKRRVNSPIEFEGSGTFDGNIDVGYFVALPIMKESQCKGFLFLGFKNRKSMDVQELEFLDVFVKHISSSLIDSGMIE